jgi:hypothetical protein
LFIYDSKKSIKYNEINTLRWNYSRLGLAMTTAGFGINNATAQLMADNATMAGNMTGGNMTMGPGNMTDANMTEASGSISTYVQ